MLTAQCLQLSAFYIVKMLIVLHGIVVIVGVVLLFYFFCLVCRFILMCMSCAGAVFANSMKRSTTGGSE